MARPSIGLLQAQGWLVTTSPLHVGGIGADADTDLAVALDGLGRLVVAGSSLAGALRAWCGGRTPESAPVRDLWGTIPEPAEAGTTPPGGPVGEEGFASRIVCEDGVVLPSLASASTWDDESVSPAGGVDPPILVERRDSVGIDRVTGAAATEILNSRAILPRGVAVRLCLHIEAVAAATPELDRSWLRAMLDALLAGQVRLGAGSTRGLGRVALDRASVCVRELRLDNRDAFLDGLAQGGADITEQILPPGTNGPPPGLPARRRVVEIAIQWEPASPVMVRAGLDGFYVDSLPLTGRSIQAMGDQAAEISPLVIPGASIKGALRSRAELVVRTVLGVDAPASDQPHRRFLRQLDQLRIVTALFGWAPGQDEVPPDLARFGRGALSVDDCYTVSEPLSADQWRALIAPAPTDSSRVERARVPPALMGQLTNKGFRQADHVAVDRWTGGAAAGALYSVLEPLGVSWQPIRLSLDLDRLGPAEREVAPGLLAVVLDEMADGRIPLGHAVNRGMGALQVTGLTIAGLPGGGAGVAPDSYAGWREGALGAWRDWVAEQVPEIETTPVP